MADYFTLVTTTGQAKLAAALSGGTPLDLTELAVGDSEANPGTIILPSESHTSLENEQARVPLQSVSQDETNANWINIEANIPAETGNFFIREVGVFDSSGDLIFIARYPETYKPALAGGASIDTTIKLVCLLTNVAAVTLMVNPALDYVTHPELAAEQKLKVKTVTDDYIITDADNDWHILFNPEDSNKTITVPAGLCNNITFIIENISPYDINVDGTAVSFGSIPKTFKLFKDKNETVQFLWRSTDVYKLTGDAMILSGSTAGSSNLTGDYFDILYPSAMILDADSAAGNYKLCATNGTDTFLQRSGGSVKVYRKNPTWAHHSNLAMTGDAIACHGDLIFNGYSAAPEGGSNRGVVNVYQYTAGSDSYELIDTLSPGTQTDSAVFGNHLTVCGDELFVTMISGPGLSAGRHYIHKYSIVGTVVTHDGLFYSSTSSYSYTVASLRSSENVLVFIGAGQTAEYFFRRDAGVWSAKQDYYPTFGNDPVTPAGADCIFDDNGGTEYKWNGTVFEVVDNHLPLTDGDFKATNDGRLIYSESTQALHIYVRTRDDVSAVWDTKDKRLVIPDDDIFVTDGTPDSCIAVGDDIFVGVSAHFNSRSAIYVFEGALA